jgi:hypothetical protein
MKSYKQLTICRAGSNRPATVRAVTEADLTYYFETAPQLSDRRILALVGRLIDYEQRGDQTKRNNRRPS